MIVRPYKGKSPHIHPDVWVAETAVLIGDVTIGPRSGVWYNVVLRGDFHKIVISSETNVQDGTIIHVESKEGPCLIGNRVTVGHRAVVHGCLVEDEVVIGMGAVILSYAKLGQGCLIAAGAVVKEHEEVPPGAIMAGVPAKVIGEVTEEMQERFRRGCERYVQLAGEYVISSPGRRPPKKPRRRRR